MKSKTVKVLSVLLAAGMLSLCMSSASGATSQNDGAAEVSASYAQTLSSSAGSTVGKEETVYVSADPDGAPSSVIVSEWLKNPDKAAALLDSSNLSDIQNVSGDETYTSGADGALTWNADGNDIYYQGTSDAELPVGVSVRYQLDGRDVGADELAGATGKLTMTFTYSNSLSKTVSGSNGTYTVYQPFAVVTLFYLDNDVAQNVTVSSGKVIDDGGKNVVVGYAMPCLAESLGLEDDENLPDSVTVTADVQDFKLLMTLTVADNSLLDNVDVENVDSLKTLETSLNDMAANVAELYGSAETEDAGETGLAALRSDADTLEEGVSALTDGVSDLKDGAQAVNSGAEALQSGTSQLEDGASDLSDGASSLYEGASTLSDGVNSLNDGVVQIQSGLNALNENSGSLVSGSADIQSALETISSALNGVDLSTDRLSELVSSSSAIQGGIDSLVSGLEEMESKANYDAFKQTMADNGLDMDALQAGDESAEESLSGIVTNLQSLNSVISSDAVQSAVKMLHCEDEYNYYCGIYTQLEDEVQQVEDMMAGNVGAINGMEAYLNALGSGVDDLCAGAKTLQTSYKQFDAAIGELADTLTDLGTSMTSLASGISQLSEEYGTFNSGLDSYTSGLGQILSGYSALVTGSAAVVSGSSSLVGGSASLASGTATLYSGLSSLAAGTDTLAEGTGALYDGTAELYDDTVTLQQGLSGLMDGADDMANVLERLEAVRDFGSEYKSYGGCVQGTDCSVKFIIETGAIGS